MFLAYFSGIKSLCWSMFWKFPGLSPVVKWGNSRRRYQLLFWSYLIIARIWFEVILQRCSYSVALNFTAGVMLHGCRLGFVGNWCLRCATLCQRWPHRSFVNVDDRNPGWLFRIQYVTAQYILPTYGSGFQCEWTSSHVLVSFLTSASRYSGNRCLCFQLF